MLISTPTSNYSLCLPLYSPVPPPGHTPRCPTSTFQHAISFLPLYLRETHDFSPLVLNLQSVHLAILLLLLDATSQFGLRGDGLLPASNEGSPFYGTIVHIVRVFRECGHEGSRKGDETAR